MRAHFPEEIVRDTDLLSWRWLMEPTGAIWERFTVHPYPTAFIAADGAQNQFPTYRDLLSRRVYFQTDTGRFCRDIDQRITAAAEREAHGR